MSASVELRLAAIGKVYGEATVLDDIAFEAEPGEIFGITGPSGAGKTSICRLISGIEKPTFGDIFIGGRNVTALSPQKRSVAYMFESYALYPQWTVERNIAFPLRAPQVAKRYGEEEIRRTVEEMLHLTEIGELSSRLPSELSGGQMQRVALCRALVQDPAVYLLDEPISHLDAKLRYVLRGAIRRRQIEREVPTLWTSPDAMEILSISDRVVVLINGKIHQYGKPEDIFWRPVNVSVARLVGDPPMNLLAGDLTVRNDDLVFINEAMTLPMPGELRRRVDAREPSAGIMLGIRPTALRIDDKASDGLSFEAQIYAWEPFGKYSIISAQVGSDIIKVRTSRRDRFEANDIINLSVEPSGLMGFDRKSGEAI